jgi:acetyltransferase-like isoleucine patch superfamily enzyme/acyl carrier protein
VTAPAAAPSLWARAAARLWLRACDRVGADVRLEGRPFIENLGRIELGEGVVLSSVPVRSHLVAGPGAVLAIGDAVRIGPGAAIAAHAAIEIGAGAVLGPYVMLMDTDFHAVADRGEGPRARPIVVGRGAVLGARAVVLPGSRIGDGARIAAGAVVSGEVPPGALASGVPARWGGPAAGEAGGPDPAERVARLLQETFRLAAPPPPSATAADVPGWDSLGSLRLLVAFEDALGVSVTEAEWVGVRGVADLAALAARRAA